MDKKSIRRGSLKKLLPQATDDQLQKIENYLKKMRLKKYEEDAQIAFEQLSK
jgi:cytochrome c1